MLTELRPIAPPTPAVVRPFFVDDHQLVTIYNADSTDLGFLPAESVHLVATSPPYNLGKDYGIARDDVAYHQYLAWLALVCRELWRVLEPGGRLCLNIPLDVNLTFDAGGRKVTRKLPFLADVTHRLVNDEGWLYNTTILWLEGNISRRTAWGSWMRASDPWVNTAAEAVLVLSKETRKRDGRGRHTVIRRDEFMDWTLGLWQFGGETTKRWGHPAPFPEELPRRLIRMFSFTDDVVLDPFLGSGTTCRAAKDLGRTSIGVELDPRFCAIAAERCRPGPAIRPEPAIVHLARGVVASTADRAYLLDRLAWARRHTGRPRQKGG